MINKYVLADLKDVPLDGSPLNVVPPDDVNTYVFEWEGTSIIPVLFCSENQTFNFGFLCKLIPEPPRFQPVARIYNFSEEECTLVPWHDEEITENASLLLDYLESKYPKNCLKGLFLLDHLANTLIVTPEGKKKYLLANTEIAALLIIEATHAALRKIIPEYVQGYIAPTLKRISNPNIPAGEKQALEEYLFNVSCIPWGTYIKPVLDSSLEAKLDLSHFGLRYQKRILSNILSIYRTGMYFPQCICFVGPPGVGKTSLIRAMAKLSGLSVSVIPLAGMRDTHQLSGFHRSYSKSSYGKIIDALIVGKSMNPLIILDEIDKTSEEIKNLLLHLLDPENKDLFIDNYFNFPINLSNIMFFATANSVQELSEPLRDRLLTIEIQRYSREEKASLILDYLLPKVAQKISLNLAIEDEVLIALSKLDNVREVEKHIYKSILEQELTDNPIQIFAKRTIGKSSMGF
jgi:Cdc6-like AAA superfamily ATPase